MSDKIYIRGLSKALFEANAKIHELEHRLSRIAEICDSPIKRTMTTLMNSQPISRLDAIRKIAKGETDGQQT